MQLDGRTVMVTGGASGLGGASAEMIVNAGGRVVILDLNQAAGDEMARRLGEANARFVKGDVTNENDVQRAVDTAVQDLGGLHGLVNAAGVGNAERVLPKEGVQPLDHFARVIQINLIGTAGAISFTPRPPRGVRGAREAHLRERNAQRRGHPPRRRHPDGAEVI